MLRRSKSEATVDELMEELAILKEQHNALLESARAILQYQDFETSLREIFAYCKKVTGATSGYVALLSEDNLENEVLFLDSGGSPCSVDENLPMPLRGLRAVALRSKKGVYENSFAESDWTKLLPKGHVRLDNVLFSPLLVEEQAVGLLGLANKEGGFSDRDLAFVSQLGDIAAIALRNSNNLDLLRKNEKRYREILATVEEGYYEVDLAGNFTFFNDSLCRMLGYTSDEMRHLSYKKIYRDTEQVYKTYNRVYRTGVPEKSAGWPVYDKEGNKMFIDVSITLCRDEEGNPTGFRGIARDVTERKLYEDKLQYLSMHDQLTGLYNRAFLEEELKQADSERQLPISIIMADLNGLKLVNDTYGHSTGDRMLTKSAQIIRDSCRKDDIVARWGGDEFVILLPNTNREDAEAICGRINEKCRGTYVGDVPLSLSMGLATRENPDTEMTDVLSIAEDTMYKQKLVESRSARSGVLNALLKTLGSKSNETEEHTWRMGEIALKIGERLGLPDSELNRLKLLIILHDIGKINIPDEILTKESPLTDEEWEIMKKHPEIGFRIARSTEDFAHVAYDILAHHEWWDGSGYPQGLRGEEIPLLARIVAIADCYEVLAFGRNYSDSLSPEEIIEEFKKGAGSQFDPKLVEIFLSII